MQAHRWIILFGLVRFSQAGILGTAQHQLVDEDEWDTIFRIYDGDGWDSHDDYLSQERSARYGDEDDSQFRSWKLDQWNYRKLMKVKVELFDDGDEVAEFEFDADLKNATSFFSPLNLRRSSYVDIPIDRPFTGDGFSFDGDDDDDRHWIVSSRHVGNCLEDEGWIQVVDKPKPGRNRCICGYENVEKYPAIMYARGNRKTRWADKNFGYADMMQVKVSKVPYPRAPVMIQPQPRIQTMLWRETKK